jgi:hypothetical protein
MAVQIIVSQVGPLPIDVTFTAVSDAPMVMEVSGSVWSQGPGHQVGVGVALDGNAIGQAQIFANPAATHLAVVPAYIPVQLAQGQHTLHLSRLTDNTMSDQNDYYNVVLHY